MGSVAYQRNHGGVAVTAYYYAFDFVGGSVECEAEEIFEAGAVKSTAHAYNAVLGQT